MKKIRLITTLFYVLVGLAFLMGGAVIAFRQHARTQDMIPADATIVAVHNKVATFVYHVNGEPYSMQSNVASDLYRVGDTYRILADPDDPRKATDPGEQQMTWVLFCIGGAFVLGGLMTHLISRRRQERLAVLRTGGIRCQGTVTRVNKNYDIDLTGNHPWAVTATCVHPRTGETVTAHEPAVWKTDLQPGDPVDVLFDPINDKLFTLDLEDK